MVTTDAFDGFAVVSSCSSRLLCWVYSENL